jgi:hypothetical protein
LTSKPEPGSTGSFKVEKSDQLDPEMLLDNLFEMGDEDGVILYARAYKVTRIGQTSSYEVLFEIVERPN